jgi:hypothetical protein
VRSPLSTSFAAAVVFAFTAASYVAHAQPAEPAAPQQPGEPPGADVDGGAAPTEEDETTPGAEPPQEAPVVLAPADPMRTEVPTIPPQAEGPPAMSEGRMLVSLYNSGFQWGIAPGVIFSRGKAGFALGLRFGYGFDTGPVILVPGVRLSGYFVDPNVYLGMPTFKLVLPIDRFAPFVEGGAGVGHVAGANTTPAETGAALMGGGGFMIHFTRVAFGAEASYQVITGTPFKGFGFGPILAIGF